MAHLFWHNRRFETAENGARISVYDSSDIAYRIVEFRRGIRWYENAESDLHIFVADGTGDINVGCGDHDVVKGDLVTAKQGAHIRVYASGDLRLFVIKVAT